MASPFPPVRCGFESTAALTNDLLEEIFLRVTSPADLARASAACVTFRRLIADPAFLRRYRSLHPPLLLGFLADGFYFAEAPHPNAAAAGALVRAGGFSFDYLPDGRWGRWVPCDVHDGRVLLSCRPPSTTGVLPDLVVCDPVSRRYLMLPAIPGEEEQTMECFDSFFAPSGDVEGTSFRVIGMTLCQTKMMVFHFSSISGCWTVGASTNWDAVIPKIEYGLSWPWYAYGCFYFKVHRTNNLLKLDINRMDFSIVDHPPSGPNKPNIVIVEAGNGRVGMFCTRRNEKFMEYYTILQCESERDNKWKVKKVIRLPDDYECYVAGEAEGYIFFVGVPKAQDTEQAVCFSLQIKTWEIETVSRIRNPHHVDPYFGYPAFMAPRRI